MKNILIVLASCASLYMILAVYSYVNYVPPINMCTVPTTTVTLNCSATDEQITQALHDNGYPSYCYGSMCPTTVDNKTIHSSSE